MENLTYLINSLKLVERYKGDSLLYRDSIDNYYRNGDQVTCLMLNKVLGYLHKIDVEEKLQSTTKLHSITNYRYQGYTKSGGLIINKVDIRDKNNNVDILKEKGTQEQKAKYKACYSTMINYKEV